MKIEVEKLNEEKEVKQEDEEDDDKHIEEEEKEDDLKELNSEVTTPESESDEISTVKEFETSRSLLSAAWKELGDAEGAADEVKRRLAKWQERYSHRLNVFVSWMMANSLCYDERINNTDITQLWRHSRSITEDIAQAETKLRDLRKEKAQEVARVAEAREEVQKARNRHSRARDKLEGNSLAPIFSATFYVLIIATCFST